MKKLARQIVKPGDTVTLTMPYSEVCMHMEVAGKKMKVEVLEHGAQLHKEDGSPFSFPILHGEAGIFRDYSVTDAMVLYIQVEPAQYV